ncbi:MAG: c-type cytochrome [Pseudomonadota bacterium]
MEASAKQDTAPVRDILNEDIGPEQFRVAVESRTLTWLTGTPANNDYVSVGRVANYFGFVALRVGSGQSLSRSDVGLDTLAVLNRRQRTALINLSEGQRPALQATKDARVAMNRALEGLLIEEPYTYESFIELGKAYGRNEAELGRVIGRQLGDVSQSLSEEQKTALAAIRGAYISGRGQELDIAKPDIRLPRDEKVDVINSAARLLSWTTGSAEYNDYEVVGKPSQHFGFVSLRTASNHSVRRGAVAREVRGLLTRDQRQVIDEAAQYNAAKFAEFLTARALLMRALEVALDGGTINAQQISTLGEAVGAIEADMTWSQAQAMLKVRQSMSADQLSALVALRAQYTVDDADLEFDDLLGMGRQLFAQCALCHNAASDFAHAPNLAGIVGRDIASAEEFQYYSPALLAYAEREKTWDAESLSRFLASPRTEVPGTTMTYSGMTSVNERSALIHYLSSLD